MINLDAVEKMYVTLLKLTVVVESLLEWLSNCTNKIKFDDLNAHSYRCEHNIRNLAISV